MRGTPTGKRAKKKGEKPKREDQLRKEKKDNKCTWGQFGDGHRSDQHENFW